MNYALNIKEDFMKNIKTIFGIAAIAVVIMLALGSCVINVPDDGPNTSLNGTWRRSDGDTVRISGDSGTWTKFGSHTGYWQDAIRQEHVFVGGPAFRNLERTGDLTWKGQERGVRYYGSTSYEPVWGDCTITMDSNGRTCRTYVSGFTNPSATWTRQ
jgi:hypothetical protein